MPSWRRTQEILRSKEFILGFVVVLIGAIYRGFMTSVMFLQPDEEIFSYDAYYFVMGRSFEFLTNEIGTYIGYPFMLSLWFRIFGVSLVSARLFSVFCSAIMLLFVFLALKKLTSSVKPAFLGTLALALLPFPLRYGHIVLTEPLVWAIISAAFFCIVKGVKDGKWYLFLISGFLMSSAFFVRRSALILLLVIFPALLWTNRDSLRSMFKEAFSFLGGFFAPMFIGLSGFILYFGYDRLVDMRFTRIPNISPAGDVNFSGTNSFENALYTLQPTTWVGAGPMLLLLAGGAVLFVSLFKDRWKGVYLGAFLWPALVRVMLDQQMSSLPMARIMVVPVVALFLNRTYKADHGFYLALSILFGSSVAFSYVFLSGDIWNVVIYCSVGAMVLVYLADRLDSRLLTLLPLIGGLISVYFITFREPQIARLLMFMLPITGVTYTLSLSVLKKHPRQIPLVVTGITVPLVFLLHPLSVVQIIFVVLISMFAAASLILLTADSVFRRWIKGWYFLRLASPVISLSFAFLMIDDIPGWGLYLPLLGIVIFMLSGYLRSALMNRFAHLIPVTGGIMAFGLCYMATSDLILSGLSGIFISVVSVIISNLEILTDIWKHKVPEKISVILFTMTVGYLGFYVFLRWTHVYMMEFLFQFALIGGLLIWVMKDTHILSRLKRTAKGYRKLLRPVRIRRRSSAVLVALIVISVPFSVGAFLEEDWFGEVPMDNRPYMRTILAVSEWIEENTQEDEMILAWHCYAVQSQRETIIYVSNAAIYNGRQVIEDMEELGVNIFVRDWYINHGLWKNQPEFQQYILSNFIIEEIIDGNECWIRNSRLS